MLTDYELEVALSLGYILLWSPRAREKVWPSSQHRVATDARPVIWRSHEHHTLARCCAQQCSTSTPLPKCNGFDELAAPLGIPGRPPPLEHPFSLPPFLFFYFYFVAALFVVGPPKNLSWPEVSWSLSEEK